ncbi:hypothetical protein [Marinobacter sp. X15-166B]|uniref:hypothetical protein n=1 Tax=Marinobacter sp. X15-166B TaxID=1897620 RepID=UPI00085CB166|nr:hypothetical protein [Marinobacter sp. X15-166B]OEY67437.1 hypothetical protein BG841_14020 [Marinobacter sp. X15-166B]
MNQRPSEFNQSVADADIKLRNMADKRPIQCLEKVAAIFGWWALSGANREEHKTLRSLAARHARRALKNLEALNG